MAFEEFGLILLVVLGVSIIARLLKQPLIIGYIVAGILVGPLVLDLIHTSDTLEVFAEMGIAFLLFIVGLHLSPKVIREVGKVSLITGLGQILFTSLIGFGIAKLVGFETITALYISVALTFSSTIIIMKLLSDKDALEKLYGKVSIGFLLVQDIVAITILIIVSSLSSGAGATEVIVGTFLKGAILMAVLFPTAKYVLPRCADFFARSQEFLFVFAISWGFGLALLFSYIGFSIEVGALIAGVMLSMTPYSYEVSSKLKVLRDFFIISFFIVLGSQMAFGDISHLLIPAIILSLFILIGNPLIVMVLMGMLGYSKKTGFMAGLTVAQISEFSLILISLGVKTGAVTQEVLSFVTIIGLTTIAGSTYMILYSDWLFARLAPILALFERKRVIDRESKQETYAHVLLGYNRIGHSIIRAFEKLKKPFVVIDFNPDIVKQLKAAGIPAMYGDVDDTEFIEAIGLTKAALIVSTIPEIETNQLVLDVLHRSSSKAVFITNAREISDAKQLYKAGADYVIMPHFLGGEFTANLIEEMKTNKRKYAHERKIELDVLDKQSKILGTKKSSKKNKRR